MGKCFCKVEHKWCKFCQRGKNCKFGEPTELTSIKKCPKRAQNETMSFKELLFKVSFEDVMNDLITYWPELESGREYYKRLYV